MLVQIYGITTVRDAVEVDRLGADHLGVVVDEGIDTWDSVDEATATEIAAHVEQGRVVALSLSTDPARVVETAALLDPAIVHVARAHRMATEALARLRRELSPKQLMLTVPVLDEQALSVAARLGHVADFLLLDTSHPATGLVGATGLVHDWALSARVVADLACPVILAGGLGPDNVSDAIAAVRPTGVDSETRTSRDDERRQKDPAKVEAFIRRARDSERDASQNDRGVAL